MYAEMQRLLGFLAARAHEATDEAAGQGSGGPGRIQRGTPMLSEGSALAPFAEVQALVKYMAVKSAAAASSPRTALGFT